MKQIYGMKGFIVIFLAVVFSFGLPTAGVAKDNILRIAFDAGDTKSMDPGRSFGTQDMALQDMIFNGLLRYKPGDISVIEPDLAERWETSKDGMALTFYLRKGVMSHPFKGYPNGVELTAEDIVFNLKKNQDPKLSTYSSSYKNFEAEIIDKYTVKIKLKSRMVQPELFFTDYRGGFVVPKKAFETIGATRFKTRPVGTGPFKVHKYTPGQKVELKAHEKYFRGKPKLDGVEVWFMPDVSSREFALRKGEVDVIEGVREQPWIDKMRKVAIVEVFGPGEINHLNFNITRKPFDNLKVRRALLYATSRDEIRTFIGPDASGPMCAIIPPWMKGGLSCEDVAKKGLLYEFNIEKAKKLLAEAGYPNGFEIEQTITERASYRRATENIQAQWKRIGVNVKLNVVDHPTYHTKIRQDVNPYVMYICMRPNADIFLSWFFHSDSIVVTGKRPVTNFSHYTGIDDLIEKARMETDPAKQEELWRQAQYKLLDEAINYPLYVLRFVFARNKKIDWGFEQKSVLALYTQINEQTRLK
ncbi:MAG: polyamine ABC transporter substrate-binding protein [Deltaproteobacteria bacterium]|nr:polyamine ABC transporter substrate-binding protein [Deltaproteobacteria bacterium]